jgi:serine/threonine protein kinase
LSEFQLDRTLGTGSFGRVHLVKLKSTGKYYAMKVLRKSEVVRMKQVEHTCNERSILEQLDFPFVVSLLGTVQEAHNVYLVLVDYIQGGELFSNLRRCGVSKLVFCVCDRQGLDYHTFFTQGHIKITDFCFAKSVPDVTWTLCGTPDYLAPEIIFFFPVERLRARRRLVGFGCTYI